MSQDQSDMQVIHKRIDELTSKVEENRKQCDHGKNNLTSIIQKISGDLGRTQAIQEHLKQSVDTLTCQSTEIGKEVAKATVRHASNSYLIKWQMTLISGLILAISGVAISFFVNK